MMITRSYHVAFRLRPTTPEEANAVEDAMVKAPEAAPRMIVLRSVSTGEQSPLVRICVETRFCVRGEMSETSLEPFR